MLNQHNYPPPSYPPPSSSKMRTFDMNNIQNRLPSSGQGFQLQTSTNSAHASKQQYREMNQQTSSVITNPNPQLPQIQNYRDNSQSRRAVQRQTSNIVISDDTHFNKAKPSSQQETYNMFKEQTLRKEAVAKDSSYYQKGERFTKSGQNVIPSGMMVPKGGNLRRDPQGNDYAPQPQNSTKYSDDNRLNSRAGMHDFRPQKKIKKSSNGFLAHNMKDGEKSSGPYESQYRSDMRDAGAASFSQLQPILENEEAQAVHLKHFQLPNSMRNKVTSTRRSAMTELSDPDNGIYFLDNDDRLYNPQGQKTPPPPMWGDVLEEDLYDSSTPFYDHDLALMEKRERQRKEQEMYKLLPKSNASQQVGGHGPKLKRKVIYVVENSKDDTGHQKPPSSYNASKFAEVGSQVIQKPMINQSEYFNYNKQEDKAFGSRRNTLDRNQDSRAYSRQMMNSKVSYAGTSIQPHHNANHTIQQPNKPPRAPQSNSRMITGSAMMARGSSQKAFNQGRSSSLNKPVNNSNSYGNQGAYQTVNTHSRSQIRTGGFQRIQQ